MTEEEAKTKICVHQPFELREDVQNRNTFLIEAHIKSVVPKCVGSKCMAWRKLKETRSGISNERADEMKKDGWKITGFEVSMLDATYTVTRELNAGYCGLAGKP